MNILLTGANGYIGKRLLPVLVEQGHTVFACVRDRNTLHLSDEHEKKVTVIEIDFLNEDHLKRIPQEIEIAYFLIHALASSGKDFSAKEKTIAENFNVGLSPTQAKQVIYLGGISNDSDLSDHLKSRQNTEDILSQSKVPLTSLRAAIIIGSGGASFEIIRDLVEKLPFMIAPKWLNTKCQPIGIRNVIEYLMGCLNKKETFGKIYDIGGPEVLTYKQMLLQFAEVRKMKRYIQTVPVMSPRISSYWLYFVTSTSYQIAVNLVESMKNEVIVKHEGIRDIINVKLLNYKENVSLAFKRIEQNYVVSSWVDSELPENQSLSHYIKVPTNGTFRDERKVTIDSGQVEFVLKNLWAIGGDRGWYYGNWLWKIRGYMDKLAGGVGLRRGRRSPTDIYAGDSLDFWRVLLADRKEKRLLLFAEMKLPGEAWLEFKIEKESKSSNQLCLVQTATFRPKGVWGRAYWFSVLPFHGFIFKNMAKNIVNYKPA